MKNTALLTILALTSAATAATTLNSGASFGTGAGVWSNGAPGPGNDGTINNNYTITGNHFLAAGTYSITQTSGDGTGGQFNLVGQSTGRVTFNLNGGTITSSTGTFFPNRIDFVLNGGSLSVVNTNIANGGVFNILSGTFTNTNATMFGTNGTGVNVLSIAGGILNGGGSTTSLINAAGATLNATLNGDAVINGASVNSIFAGTGTRTLNILSSWTGEMNLSGVIDWSDALQSSGATLNGVDIDATNIDQFIIAGGNIRLVPEPSSSLLFGLGALGLVMNRRRKA